LMLASFAIVALNVAADAAHAALDARVALT